MVVTTHGGKHTIDPPMSVVDDTIRVQKVESTEAETRDKWTRML